jgi:hypothetical protein
MQAAPDNNGGNSNFKHKKEQCMTRNHKPQAILQMETPERNAGWLWLTGTYFSYHFGAKVYATSSEFGIDDGQIVKFYLEKGDRSNPNNEVACYERGWETHPETPEDNAAMDFLIGLIGNLPLFPAET